MSVNKKVKAQLIENKMVKVDIKTKKIQLNLFHPSLQGFSMYNQIERNAGLLTRDREILGTKLHLFSLITPTSIPALLLFTPQFAANSQILSYLI